MSATTKRFVPLMLGSIGSVALAAIASPVQAITIFNFSTPSVVNYDSTQLPLTDTVDGITGSLSAPVGANQPSSALFNTNQNGLCTFYNNNGSSLRRCGSTPANGGDDASTFTGFTASFDKPVFLKRFEVTQWENLSSGTINFQVGTNSQLFSFTGVGIQSFSSGFEVAENTQILVTTSGVIQDNTSSGAFRITGFTVEEVPGPLPILAAGAAFGWSRKLKNKYRPLVK